MDERDLYNKYHQSDNAVSTTISTIVVQGGPLQLVIALLRVRRFLGINIKLWMVRFQCWLKSFDTSSSWRLPLRVQMQISIKHNVGLRHDVLNGDDFLYLFSRPSQNTAREISQKRDFNRWILCWKIINKTKKKPVQKILRLQKLKTPSETSNYDQHQKAKC